MTPAEIQTFIVAFLFLLGSGIAGALVAKQIGRIRAKRDGVQVEPTARVEWAAVLGAAIMLDIAFALAWVLIGRQAG